MNGAVAALILAVLAGPAMAQQQTLGPSGSAVVTLDQDRLFAESMFGRAVTARSDAEAQALAAENRKIEAALEAEERDLTLRRKSLPVTDFRTLADAFDVKAEELRTAQTAKSRALGRRLEEERKLFFEAALPILGALMTERGAVAILSRDAIVLSFDRIDITESAIVRLDAELGDGSKPATPPTPAPDTPVPPAPDAPLAPAPAIPAPDAGQPSAPAPAP